MDVLLDTCVFIWWDSGGHLSPGCKATLQDPANNLFLSVASVWEMQLKYQKGKLSLSRPLSQIVNEQISFNRLQLLPIEADDVYAVGQLPSHHADPFDRIIIAQAVRRRLTIVTDDNQFASYNVGIIR